MKLIGTLIALMLLTAAPTLAQEKGVDTQSQKVRDTGSNREAGVNGTKTDVGTSGSGINFGRGKTWQSGIATASSSLLISSVALEDQD